MIEIIEPTSASQLDHVRALIREFTRWYRQRHIEDLELINEYFDAKI